MNGAIWLVVTLGLGIITIVGIWKIWRRFKGTKSGFPTDKHELMTVGTTLIVLGIMFGEERLIGYAFIGVGILLSIYYAIKSKKEKPEKSLRVSGRIAS
jgi:hypothetical protein